MKSMCVLCVRVVIGVMVMLPATASVGLAEVTLPRITEVSHPSNTGNLKEDDLKKRICYVDTGLEKNIVIGDVLNVYREDRSARGNSTPRRTVIGTIVVPHEKADNDFRKDVFKNL